MFCPNVDRWRCVIKLSTMSDEKVVGEKKDVKKPKEKGKEEGKELDLVRADTFF